MPAYKNVQPIVRRKNTMSAFSELSSFPCNMLLLPRVGLSVSNKQSSDYTARRPALCGRSTCEDAQKKHFCSRSILATALPDEFTHVRYRCRPTGSNHASTRTPSIFRHRGP